MNPTHPSGFPAPADPASGVSSASYDSSGHAYAPYGAYDAYDNGQPYGDADPLFGSMPGVTIPAQAGPPQENPGYATDGYATAYGTAEWTGWSSPGAAESYTTESYDSQTSTSWGTGSYETGPYDAAAYGTAPYETAAYAPPVYEPPGYEEAAYAPATAVTVEEPREYAVEEQPQSDEPVVEIAAEPGAYRTAARGRRRSARPRRSALLTVAAPSVAVLGVAGVAAASVSGAAGVDQTTTQASAPDPATVKSVPSNTKLDTQLAGLSDGAVDFADRASRTQERIDLKKRQKAERERKAEEAARKEALRPKFVQPVAKGAGISAYFGQAGVNWMSVHTGIDFPVSYGTPVHAATDGTIATKWNSAYGNMAIVTASDGTETWYCHLSSTRVRSGPVKAGDLIAYSGSSGNSTGPHLHFEVHPGGGAASDPMPWFRSHGIEPG